MSVWISPEPPSYGELAPLRIAEELKRAGERVLLRLRLPIALSAGLVAGLLVLALFLPGRTPRDRISSDAGASVWTVRPDAQPLLALDLPMPATLARSYEAMGRERSAEGLSSEREDRLTIGAFESPDAYIRLIVRRAADAGQMTTGFFIDAVHHAADAGLALEKFGRQGRFVSRFGPVETAGVVLSQAGTSRSDCAALRFGAADAALDFMALACPAANRAFDEGQLACLVARLDAIVSGDEPAVRRYLQAPRQAGRASGDCGLASATLVAATDEKAGSVSSVAKTRH